MDISNFDYIVPDELIAQHPPEVRGSSRLLIADCSTQTCAEDIFSNIPSLLPDDCFLVVNNSRVVPARVPAVKITGGKSEIFFLKQTGEKSFKALIKGRLKKDDILLVGTEKIRLVNQDVEGIWEVGSEKPVFDILSEFGKIPLPPYIQRNAGKDDSDRYQTVYSDVDRQGSVAAPTAGLHFTDKIYAEVLKKGIEIVPLTLHVGIGTFRPVKCDNINDHTMHSEDFSISEESAEKINSLIKSGKKPFAVGTTSVRTLESAAGSDGLISRLQGSTDLFIKPGYDFKVVKGMITNFHQPKSSLFIMISTFMGMEFARKSYETAVEKRFKFFSYGDSMLIKK